MRIINTLLLPLILLSQLASASFVIPNGAVTRPKLATGGVGKALVVSISATATIDTTTTDIAILSGASFTLTLPTAVGIKGQLLTIIHNGTSLSQVYTLATTSSQTIGGIASGSYAEYTNSESLTIFSDGANWKIKDHKTATGPVSLSGNLPTFAGFGTPTSVVFFYERSGSDCILWGSFVAGSTTGTGAIITLPTGLANIDTTGMGAVNRPIGTWASSNVNNSSGFMLYVGFSNEVDFGAILGSAAPQATTINGNAIGGSGTTVRIGPTRFTMSGWQP